MTAEQLAHLRHPKHVGLHIFKRETGGWYAGFHKDQKYHRRATRTHDLKAAMQLAEDWYLDRQAEARLGMFEARAPHTVKECAKLAMKRLEERVARGERSESYKRGIEQILTSEVLPFFGSLGVAKVGPAKWSEYETQVRTRNPKLTRQTLHQHRNALRFCLNEAIRREWIKALPTLKLDAIGKAHETPRIWFETPELRRLLKAARQHITELSGTRWVGDAEECYDFIIWMANTGMRVGEARNVRFCDVEVATEASSDGLQRRYCLIKNIKGKRGTGECRSWYAACNAFSRLVKRRGIADPAKCSERLFLAHHRDMFNTILEKADLKFTTTEPRAKRDFVSLRHTYIASRLLHGVSVYDIARNCRTSVAMIEKHYTRFLSPRWMIGLNKFEARK